MPILVVNCGSSTLKFRLYNDDPAALEARPPLASGVVERIGGNSRLQFEARDGEPKDEDSLVADHAEATKRALMLLRDAGLGAITAVGLRVVHGGTRFTEPVLLDDSVIAEIDRLTELAPLHNGPALEAIGELRAELGADVPMVVSFDTSFHSHMPDRAALYALPLDLQKKHDIRRYGFHGLAHRYMLERYAALASVRIDQPKLITLQLGAGCSAAAIAGGHSIDTSMGFTPLEGLMMATRSGDIDPSLAGFIAAREGISIDEADRLLNEDSGLKGVSGISTDMRDLLEAEAGGHSRAALAIEIFCYRITKIIGAYFAALGSADAIVFGGGIGENAAEIRRRVCEPLASLGVSLEPSLNEGAVGGVEAAVHATGSRLQVWVIPVNESLIIARDTMDCLRTSGVGEAE